MEIVMTPVARRAALTLAVAAIPAALLPSARAVDALPDARFVGFAQTVNDFEIASGRMALVKSLNENIRGFATRTIADYGVAAEKLDKARAEAGVSYAPDPAQPPDTAAILQRLAALEGPEFDTAYANAQLAVHSEADQQYGAYSQSGQGGALRRYAEQMLPTVKMHFGKAQRLAGSR
jgi:putative membrane protein